MDWYEIFGVTAGSGTVIFLLFWFSMLVWQAFFPKKKTGEDTLMVRIREWFGELTLILYELLI